MTGNDLTTLLVSHAADGVLNITLNRPEVRNAMSMVMVQELRQVLAEAQTGGDVRVVILRGAGGHFCAGGDVRDMANARMNPSTDGSDPVARVSTAFGDLCVDYANTGLVVMAVVEGTVMGGGFGLSCVADVVIASDTANFRLPETSLGIVPAQIGPFLVERLGYSEAKRLAVSGGKLDAQAAFALGLVHEVHPTEALEGAIAKQLSQILQCAPRAIASTKALLAKARFATPASLVQEAAMVFSRSVNGPEGQEGTGAFIQKRKPQWAPQ